MKKLPTEAERLEIIRHLIAVRHFNGLWLKGPYLYARRELCEDPRHLHWEEARRIIEAARQVPKKAAQSELGARRAPGARRKV